MEKQAMNYAESANRQKKLHFVTVAVDGSVATTVYAPQEVLSSCSVILASLGNPEQIEISTEVLSPHGRICGIFSRLWHHSPYRFA